jgi:hypothetical protein
MNPLAHNYDKDSMPPEIEQALQALPQIAKDYLNDLIGLTLGNSNIDEVWTDEWYLVRTALGGTNPPTGTIDTPIPPGMENEPEDDGLDDELVALLDAELEDELQAGPDKEDKCPPTSAVLSGPS